MNKMLKYIIVAAISLCGVSAQALVLTNSNAGAVGGAYAARDAAASYVVSWSYDARGNAMAASNDTAIVLQIRSNSLVRAIRYAVTVSNGTATTFNISDSRSATQFIATVTGTVNLAPTLTPVNNTGFYQSNDSIRIWANDAVMTGIVINGTAEIIDFTP